MDYALVKMEVVLRGQRAMEHVLTVFLASMVRTVIRSVIVAILVMMGLWEMVLVRLVLLRNGVLHA